MSTKSISDIDVQLIQRRVPELGLTLRLKDGNKCNETSDYGLILQLNCDQYATRSTYSLDTASITESPCVPRIIFNSYEACPKYSMGTLWRFWNDHYEWFATSLMLLGLYLMTVGGRFYKITLFLSGELTISVFLTIIMFAQIYPDNTPTWVVWLTGACSFGIGLGVGYASYRWARLGVLIIGTWVGGLIGALIYELFFSLFVDDDRTLGIWLTIACCAVLVAVGSMFFFDHVVILGSSISGSYLFFRVSFIVFIKFLQGFAEFAEGYPNEFIIYEDYENETLDELESSFYVYVAFMVIFAIGSILFQLRERSKNQEVYNYRKYDFKYRRN